MTEPAKRLVVASANPDKAAEIAEILTSAGVEVLARPAGLGGVEETEDTLEGNARLKAAAVCEATAEAAVADDTGLEVEALRGAPGVWSARYAGENATYADNVAKLLEALEGESGRAAVFRTVVVVRWPGGGELVVEGEVKGRIATEPRGSGGFGYDPVFIPDGAGGRTYAQMAQAEKQSLSHRGRALRALAARLAWDPPGSEAGP